MDRIFILRQTERLQSIYTKGNNGCISSPKKLDKLSKLRLFLLSSDVKVTTAKVTYRTQSMTRGSNCLNASLHCKLLPLSSSIHMNFFELVYHMWKSEKYLWKVHSNFKLLYAVVSNLKGCSCNNTDSKSMPLFTVSICKENVMFCIKLQPSNKTTLIMYQHGKIGLHMTNFLCLIWICFISKVLSALGLC